MHTPKSQRFSHIHSPKLNHNNARETDRTTGKKLWFWNTYNRTPARMIILTDGSWFAFAIWCSSSVSPPFLPWERSVWLNATLTCMQCFTLKSKAPLRERERGRQGGGWGPRVSAPKLILIYHQKKWKLSHQWPNKSIYYGIKMSKDQKRKWNFTLHFHQYELRKPVKISFDTNFLTSPKEESESFYFLFSTRWKWKLSVDIYSPRWTDKEHSKK